MLSKYNTNVDQDDGDDTLGVLAQLVAQPFVRRKVAGSSPVHPVNLISWRFLFFTLG